MARSLDELEAEIDAVPQQTVLVVAWEVRDMCDESRLKELARARIQERLQQCGLVALPEVPGDQGEELYVTRIGSDVHKLWNSFASPSPAGLRVLAGATGKAKPVVGEQAQLKEIEELLGDAHDLVVAIRSNGGSK
jgi:hypothetical protein